MASQMFNLTWNDFEKCVSNSFKELLDREDFVDVTLATEDNRKLKCHKVVISACSPVLKSILEKYPHPHPLIYLSGVKYAELRSLVNFMYLGQTEVAQDVLNDLMRAASKLEIQGLSNCQEYEEPKPELPKNIEHGETIKNERSIVENDNSLPPQFEQTNEVSYAYEGDTFSSLEDASFTTNSKALTKSRSEHKCDQCEYRSNFKSNVKAHMKAKHEGIKYPCDVCEYKASYLQDLIKHKRVQHSTAK